MNSLNPVLRIRRSIQDVLGRKPDADEVAALLAQVGLQAAVADRYPHELSGGMKQRVCIALAICRGPRLIIADEPTSALDVVTQRQVMRTLHEAQERLGSALILIGHDMGLMAQSVGRMAVMRGGRLLEAGPTARLFAEPATAYTAELIRSVPVIDGSAHPVPPPSREGTDLLRFEAVAKSYGGGLLRPPAFTALHPLSFAFSADPPRILSVVGQSGSGKSTIGSLILGFTRPTTGVVRYQGRDVAGLRGAARRAFRREVQAIFQDPYSAFNPFYRVERSLTLPLRSFGLAASAAEARHRAEAACRDVGLNPAQLMDRFPHQLSGGQRQRLMVARALLLRPLLLVADEPVSMVDASLRAAILELLVELRDRHGISTLYITHDLATAYRVSDEVMVLRAGRVVEAGDPAEVFERPAHPYTRLLIDCLPWPDPARPWGSPEQEASLRHEIDRLDGQPPLLRTHRMPQTNAA
jgi:peptide/nickel transport system ATP-binding protein